MVKKWSKGLLGILLCLTLFSGCLGAALVGAGASGAMTSYNWIEGTMTMDYPKSVAEMDQAVQQVCKEYRIKVTDRKMTPTKGIITGVDPNGENVKITLDAKPNSITAVGVHVGGFMGNKGASEMFHKQLAKDLGL